MTALPFDDAAALADFDAAGRTLKAQLRGTVHWPPRDDAGRTYQKVRRNSVWERLLVNFFIPLGMDLKQLILRYAERLCFEGMLAGRREARRWWGHQVRPKDLALLRHLLFERMDRRTGRVDPSYKQIHERTGLATGSISGAIKRLVAIGILEKQRRFRTFDGEDGATRVEQISNAYRFRLPQAAREKLGARPISLRPGPLGAVVDGPAPPPDDDHCRRQAAIIQRGVDHQAETGQASLESALGRLGEAVASSDCDDRRESRARSLPPRDEDG